jgi:hypothetical protein
MHSSILSSRCLTPDQASNFLNIPVRTLEGFRRRGIGPAYIAVGYGVVTYTMQALQEWLASHTVSSTAQARVVRGKDSLVAAKSRPGQLQALYGRRKAARATREALAALAASATGGVL